MPFQAISSFRISIPAWISTSRTVDAMDLEVPRWRQEVERYASRYHISGSWFAAVANLLFALNDVIVFPEMAGQFFVVRLAISVTIALALILRKRMQATSSQIAMLPFLLISMENAYMWSFMDKELFHMHSLAYAVLFVGASIVVLWPYRSSLLVLVASGIMNWWFLQKNSPLSLQEIMANGGTLVSTVAVISTIMAHNRFRLTKREIVLRSRLKASKKQVVQQKALIEKNHDELRSSVFYSQNIQLATLPSKEELAICFKDHFVLYKPKDIVSGDFYWCKKLGGRSYIAVADCTGHGVPGALMSMLGSALLNKVIVDAGERSPALILDRLRDEVINALRQNDGNGSKDGMDISLCVIDPNSRTITHAGAFNPLYIIRDGVLIDSKADRMPIGIYHGTQQECFSETEHQLQAGDMCYMFSDGFADQFGGGNGKKFGRRRFKELLCSMAPKPVHSQRADAEFALTSWQKDTPSVDDVLLLGFRV